MTDTVTRLMEHADHYSLLNRISPSDAATFAARQALEAELVRLFTPLSDEQIKQACKETWVFDTAKQWVRNVEKAHGIGGES